jgi:hypothetical protein
MKYLIGLFLSLAVAGLAIVIGFDRESTFYPTGPIVIVSYYVLLAWMVSSGRTLVAEDAVAADFCCLPKSATGMAEANGSRIHR